MSKIKWLLVAGAVLGSLGTGVRAEEAASATTAESLSVDQRLKVLERKFELAQEAAEEKKKTAAAVFANEKEGLGLKSEDGAFAFRARGFAQADGRFFVDDQRTPLTNTFLMRKARIIFDATVFRDYDIYVVPDLAGSAVSLVDAYLDVHIVPQLRFRFGKTKTPVGLERLQNDVWNRFAEQAIATTLSPNRDLGAQVYGDLWGGALSYAAGVFNGVNDGVNGDADNNDSKDVAARVFAVPFKNSSNDWVNGFGAGIGGSYGHQIGSSLSTYRTSGQNAYFTYLTSATADGSRTRVAPQLYYYKGPFSLLAEYIVSTQEVRKGTQISKLAHQAWEVSASYLLTGEKNSYKGLTPRRNFDPKNGGWGAWELAGRYGEFYADDAAFDRFGRALVDPLVSASRAVEWAAGVNWYLNKNVRVTMDYFETRFEGGASRLPGNPALLQDRETEKTFITRFQIAL